MVHLIAQGDPDQTPGISEAPQHGRGSLSQRVEIINFGKIVNGHLPNIWNEMQRARLFFSLNPTTDSFCTERQARPAV